jgi:hypothetical protein
MFRRTIALALAGLALAAPPALAHSNWNSQMKHATETASRAAGGCSIKPGWQHGSLLVTCDSRHTATLVYSFPIGHSSHDHGGHGHGGIQGTPTSGVSWWGHATVHHSVKVAGGTLRVTVTVTRGTAVLSSVSVGYYR